MALLWLRTLSLALLAGLAASEAADGIHGDASFTGSTPSSGTCSFTNYAFPAGLSGVGIGPSNYANGTKCGSCLLVDGPKGSTLVMITDSCPSCAGNRINLLTDAFDAIGDKTAGIIPVTYYPVSCGLTTPLSVRNKEGTSRYFFSMQVLDANYPVISLEVSTDNLNTWKPTTRRDYNYFENGGAGFGADVVAVRITCSNNRQVIIPNVPMTAKLRTLAPVNC